MSNPKTVFYRDVLFALDVSPDDPYPKLKPKTPEELKHYRAKLEAIFEERERADLVLGLAIAGCFDLVRNLYPAKKRER